MLYFNIVDKMFFFNKSPKKPKIKPKTISHKDLSQKDSSPKNSSSNKSISLINIHKDKNNLQQILGQPEKNIFYEDNKGQQKISWTGKLTFLNNDTSSTPIPIFKDQNDKIKALDQFFIPKSDYNQLPKITTQISKSPKRSPKRTPKKSPQKSPKLVKTEQQISTSSPSKKGQTTVNHVYMYPETYRTYNTSLLSGILVADLLLTPLWWNPVNVVNYQDIDITNVNVTNIDDTNQDINDNNNDNSNNDNSNDNDNQNSNSSDISDSSESASADVSNSPDDNVDDGDFGGDDDFNGGAYTIKKIRRLKNKTSSKKNFRKNK